MKQILVEFNDSAQLESQISEIQQEWESGAYCRLLFHVYSGLEDEQHTVALAKKLHDLFPDAGVVGTMSAGEIANGHLMQKGTLIGALLFETTNATVVRYDGMRGHEGEIGKQIRSALDAMPDIRAAELVFPGIAFETTPLLEEISKCSSDVKVFGGYSGGHGINASAHFVFDHTGVLSDTILVTAFAGKDLHVDMDKVIGWEPLGLPFTVTKASGNKLFELDGRPASELYEKFLQIDRSQQDNAEEGYTFPLLAQYKGDEWLRSAIHIDEDGALDMHGQVVEGMDIQLSYGNPTTIIEQVNKRLDVIRAFKPQALLLFSCIVRKVFWVHFADLELVPFQEICPTGGFYTWGELLRDARSGEVVEHNVTLLSVAMREGEAPAGELPVVYADDSVLMGPAAQMRRLTSLIRTTMEDLQKAQRDLRELNEKLTVMAEHDALTGIFNRRKTEEELYRMLDESAAQQTPLSLIMVDVDYFKNVNDEYGHQVGDAVLQEIAGLLQTAVDAYPGGIAGRWGGEEFFLAIPDMMGNDVLALAERIRKTVEEHAFPEVKNVTISLGVMTVQGQTNYRSIFARVDDALYSAKEGGRNRVFQTA